MSNWTLNHSFTSRAAGAASYLRFQGEDAKREANQSECLHQTAQENLQSVIEALLSPIMKQAGYQIMWQ